LGRLRVLSGADVVEILEQGGFAEVRRKGSHVSMQKSDGGRTLTVIVPMHRELRTGTLLSIIRQSKLSRSEFEHD